MSYAVIAILVGLLGLPCTLLAERPITEAAEHQHFPAEITLPLADLPQETQEENNLFVQFAMAGVFPDDIETYSDEELKALIDEKAASLEQVLERYPKSEVALESYYTLLDHPDYYERLLATVRKLYEQGADSADFYRLLLATLDVCGKDDEVAKYVPEALAAHPESKEIFLMAIAAYIQADDQPALDSLLENVRNSDDFKCLPIVQVIQLRRLIEGGKKDEAKDLLFKIVQNDLLLQDPATYFTLICQELAPIEALREVSIICAAILMRGIASLDQESVQQIFYYCMLAACGSGAYDVAEPLLEKIIADVTSGNLQKAILFDLSSVLHKATQDIEKDLGHIPVGLLKLNIQIGQAVHKTLPVIYRDDNADRTLGRYLLQDGDYEEALKLFQHIQEPDSTDLFLQATLLEELKHPQEALKIMRGLAVTEAGTIKAPFYMFLGDLESQCGHQQESDEAIQKALELDPQFDRAANYLGYSYAERGINLDEAERLLTIALSREPDNSAYLDSMAWLKFKQGDYHEALRWMAKAFHVPDTTLEYEAYEEMQKELMDHLQQILRALHCDYLADCYQ